MTTDPFAPAPQATGPRTIRVQDQHQVLEFEGERIGFASTETGDTVRWTEIEIFRTVGGNYVVHRVGASVVYHAANGPCASGQVTTAGKLFDDEDDEHVACDRCRPGKLENLPPQTPLRREMDRHSADSAGTAEELVKALTLRRPNGSSYLSAVAREALADAAAHDPSITALTTKTVRIS